MKIPPTISCSHATTILLLLLFSSTVLKAQVGDESEPKLHDSWVSAGLVWSFLDLGGTIPLPVDGPSTGVECGSFRDGTGDLLGPRIGFRHLLSNRIGVEASIELLFGSTRMSFPCLEEAGIRNVDGEVVPAVTEFVRDQERTDITITLGGSYYLVAGLFLELGLSASSLARSTISLSEQIVSPASATFVDGGGQTRAVIGSTGPDEAGMWSFGGVAGAGYELKAGSRFLVIPRVAVAWSSMPSEGTADHRLSVGVSGAYTFDLRPRSSSSPLEPAEE